ncbi:MAG: indolepyruvate oxidoreductase subunit beta [Clostridiales bacterium]|jgi:indolepyruvate ferredoxin oxidoreductase beta subunit|nr:indolepyruvate oxidoreductase subunit beta [Clostridiales bacterium]
MANGEAARLPAAAVLIVGVGGQGTLLASKLIGHVATERGCDVKVSEVHGMSQRGGSVVTYVKYGGEVFSPLIEPGEADVVVAFELLEAARWIPYLKPGGQLISSSQRIDPMPVITGAARYPGKLEESICEKRPGAIIVDALAIATECGSARSANIVLLGIAARFLEFAEGDWAASIRAITPQRALGANLEAFRRGYGIAGALRL